MSFFFLFWGRGGLGEAKNEMKFNFLINQHKSEVYNSSDFSLKISPEYYQKGSI